MPNSLWMNPKNEISRSDVGQSRISIADRTCCAIDECHLLSAQKPDPVFLSAPPLIIVYSDLRAARKRRCHDMTNGSSAWPRNHPKLFHHVTYEYVLGLRWRNDCFVSIQSYIISQSRHKNRNPFPFRRQRSSLLSSFLLFQFFSFFRQHSQCRACD